MKTTSLLASLSVILMMNPLGSLADEPTKQICDLRKTILSIAEHYRGQEDPNGSKQKYLEYYIRQLINISNPISIEEKVKRLRGGWEQVWGPYRFDRLDGFQLDANNMYQIIYPEGYYYNVGFSTFYGQATTGFVRGEYEISGDRLEVHFTENQFAAGFLPEKINLVDLGKLKEAHFLKTQDVPGGISGEAAYLNEVYVDNLLRITYGSRDGSDDTRELYVLKRIEKIKPHILNAE